MEFVTYLTSFVKISTATSCRNFSSSCQLYMQLTWRAHMCSQSGSEWYVISDRLHTLDVTTLFILFFLSFQCVRYKCWYFFLLNMFYGYTLVYWWFMYIHICIREFCVNFCQNTSLLLFLQKLNHRLCFFRNITASYFTKIVYLNS